MSKGRDSQGEVLFSRGCQDGDSTADDWDDTELLKEYDRAVRPIKALVAERMGLTNEEVEEASASESCSSSRSVVDKRGPKPHHRNSKKKSRKGKKRHQRDWAIGDHCQARFTADNQWYEATIISLDRELGVCNVQYVGYGNKEELPLSSIGQSMGAAVRREQVRISNMEKDLDPEASQTDDIFERSSQASSSASHSKRQPSFRKNKHNTSEFSSINGATPFFSGISGPGFSGFPGSAPSAAMHDMVAPPLPPHIMASLPVEESEALSAMLMSWYMSGFHTGFYQGLKRAKNVNSPQHSNLH